MTKPEIHVRRAGVEDAAEIARLLRDFNLEYSEPAPAVEALAETIGRLLADRLYESMGFTNREGSPGGPSMLFYEREI